MEKPKDSSAVPWVLPGVLVALFFLAAAEREKSTIVQVRLTDSTGRVTPAMVCITGAEDGIVRLPPDGRPNPPVSKIGEFTGGVDFQRDPDWIGPVRKTTGIGNNQDRSYVYESLPSLPYWREPVMYQTSGEFAIRLPDGAWRIAVQRGSEHVPVLQEFRTRGGTQEVAIRLERWIDLPSEGWYSGDVHVHHPTTEARHRDFLLEYARAEDVHLVNVLEQHHHVGRNSRQIARHSTQAGFGKKFRVEKEGRWLVSGQEAPSSQFGHIIGLNIEQPVLEPQHFDLYDEAFDAIHEQDGALVGYAHFSWNGCDLPRGFPWHVTTRQIDFVELLQFAKINALDYYDYLNLGFRLVAAAGSDVPWGSTLGEVRTYVQTGDGFDPDRWFAGLKAGHTFVSNGPALDFTIDGSLPGADLQRKRGDRIRVQAHVRSHEKIGLPLGLRLVTNNGLVKETLAQAGESELRLQVELALEQSGWYAASAECANGAVAHSSPIYVVVDGQPTWSATRGSAAIEKQLAAIRKIEAEFQNRPEAAHRNEILDRLKSAQAFYAELREKMTK